MPAKKKPDSSQGPRKGAHLMDQFGIGMNMHDFESMLYDDDDDINDEDLEAELAALQGEDLPRKKEKTKRKNLMPFDDINKMAAESLRDIPSDEDISDTEDPELLLELSNLTQESPSPPPLPSRTSAPSQVPGSSLQSSPEKSSQQPPATAKPQDIVSLLTDRVAMYRTAYENASATSDSSKQRRLNRGIKTLQELLRNAQAGRPIDEDSIPPPVAVKARAPPSSLPTSAKVPNQADLKPSESASQPTPPSLPARNVVSPSAPSPPSPSLRSGEIPSPSKSPIPAPRTLNSLESPGRKPPAPGAIPVLPSPPSVQPRGLPGAKSPTSAGAIAQPKASPTPSPNASPAPHNQRPVASSAPNISNLSASDQQTHHLLCFRRDQYRSSAVAAKHSGDIRTATKYAQTAKQFNCVIKALEEGKPIDLSKMPPPPPGCPEGPTQNISTAKPNLHVPVERSSQAAKEPTPPSNTEDIISVPPLPTDVEKKLYNAPDQPITILDALNQRMAKYKSCEEEAKASGNSSKVRRMGRIVKQYQDSIKLYKAGKPVNFDELPTPPGFGPIPTNDSSAPPTTAPAAVAAAAVASPAAQSQKSPRVPPQPQMRQQQQPQPTGGEQISEGEIRKRACKCFCTATSLCNECRHIKRRSTKRSLVAKQFARRSVSSRQEQQVVFLKERMAEYRNAAIQAKKENNMELAKAYLRQAKGFEPMLEAAEGGLPVDLTKVPPPLNMDEDYEDKFVFVNPEDCEISGDRDEVYQKLQESLVSQIQMCSTSSKHFTKMGDVLSASRFQKLEQGCTKDLDSLKNAHKHGDPVPRFHYETKTFSMVQCNSELGDNDLELTIVRGIKFNLPSGYAPKDLDTYIKFEFPFPSDDPQTHTTETVKNTDSPEYGESFKLNINRRSRALLRVFEKKSMKLEVYYRRGFLKSDKILGTISVKLQPLESKCTIHDSFDLMDGRKSVGGKLEVKLKLRDPLKNKQVEEVKEKWLIIDKFLQKKNEDEKPSVTITVADKQAQLATSGSTSMEVLKYEKQQLDKQICHLKDSLTSSQLETLSHKSKLLQEKIEKQKSALKAGGKAAFKGKL
ncbi:CC2D1 [Acanthosepion pharaonis]|uniref:CC2D1 n=1 Tax=Acanthosepion pharaonis TaxID=158019 RepID=A0A812B9V0_ACAPH|nr:CC2D1 [Sepia pharaonis]